ncbi:hypothetical protein NCZ26_20730 [Bacteroides ovatus]|uniref:hypothetical protein n=1 Tax=Bacteroides ovatus TaxID=28116 RepID=UPI00202FBDCB|nr:hypothetical protein [Bacteroides ovatus]MCM1722625.1 hypothetical protein [Bacteroides ovatus]MCM1757669.1 hypothetical protein [Bacteroides ovatus]MCM1869123.1 hypothetical protein [Bacteroides ovatus]
MYISKSNGKKRLLGISDMIDGPVGSLFDGAEIHNGNCGRRNSHSFVSIVASLMQ